MAMNNWMGAVPSTKKLCEITMPGAHDAGMVKRLMNKAPGAATIANACCQLLTIGEQLQAGIRWVDVRLKKRPKVCGGPRGFRGFHSTTFGETSRSIAEGIINFLNANNTETVVVALTKSDDDSYPDFLSELSRAHRATAVHGAPPFAPYARCGHDNQIAAMKLGSLRGRVIVAMDEPPASEKDYRIVRAKLVKYDGKVAFQPAMYEAFDRDAGRGKYDFVLNVAGSYSRKNNSRDIMSGQLTRINHIKAGLNPNRPWLGMYYTTNTSAIGLRATSIEAADKDMWRDARKQTWSPVAFQKKPGGNSPLVNILMMDFAEATRCQHVIISSRS